MADYQQGPAESLDRGRRTSPRHARRVRGAINIGGRRFLMFRFRPGSMPVLALLVLTSGIAWYSGRAQANGQAAGLLPRVVLGEQFNQDPQLVAEPQQAILVTSDSLDPSGRFRLAAGLHRFCFNAAGRFS